MDSSEKNSTGKQNQRPDFSSLKRMAVFAVLFVALLIAGLYLKQKLGAVETTSEANQESFQGPAELSTAVQQDCQQTAKEILNEVDCKIKDEKFLASLGSCHSAGYSTETSEGNFTDLSIHISKCYFEKMNDKARAIQILDKTEAVVPEWEVFQGPISCPSKPILSALKESYADTKKFTCIKSADLAQLAMRMQNKEFTLLNDLVKPGHTVQQGYMDSDASCTDTMSTMVEILNKLTKNAFSAKELVDVNPSEEKVNDRYIEFYAGSRKSLNLHFKIDAEDCLNFVSILAESTELSE